MPISMNVVSSPESRLRKSNELSPLDGIQWQRWSEVFYTFVLAKGMARHNINIQAKSALKKIALRHWQSRFCSWIVHFDSLLEQDVVGLTTIQLLKFRLTSPFLLVQSYALEYFRALDPAGKQNVAAGHWWRTFRPECRKWTFVSRTPASPKCRLFPARLFRFLSHINF